MASTWWFAPPCFQPFSEPMAPAYVEYGSVSAEVSTRVVNVELLPPPCSACRHSMTSSIRASSSVNWRSGRSMDRMVSAVDWPGMKRCMIMDSLL